MLTFSVHISYLLLPVSVPVLGSALGQRYHRHEIGNIYGDREVRKCINLKVAYRINFGLSVSSSLL